jgi:hypothetical protein
VLCADDRLVLGRSGALLAVAQALADGGKALADYRASQCDPHAMLAQAALQSLPWSELQMAVAVAEAPMSTGRLTGRRGC